MAVGDSIARLAARLDAVTAGSTITACDVRHPRFATADLTGQRIVGRVPRGQHLLMRTDAAITVHSHLHERAVDGAGSGQAAAARLPPGCGSRCASTTTARSPGSTTTPVAFTDAARTPHGRETWWCPGCQR